MNSSLTDVFQTDLLPHLGSIAKGLEDRLRETLLAANIRVQFVQGRIKSPESLRKKLARPDREYSDLLQVTDILAFRIVAYSEDLIAPVARLVEESFGVDFENSENRLQSRDTSRFGYRSLHYVCGLPAEYRESLPEPFRGLRYEIQIRTALQHVWAEIEHDIGYKAAERLPEEFKRRFSQIASLLEVADREFAAIRTGLSDYESRLRSANAEEVELDEISLKAALDRAEIVALDEEIASILELQCSDSKFYPDYILKSLRSAGFKRVGEVLRSAQRFRSELKTFAPVYFDFAKKHLAFDSTTMVHVDRGYGLLFVAHLEVIQGNGLLIDRLDQLARLYQETDFPSDSLRARKVARAWGEVLQAPSN